MHRLTRRPDGQPAPIARPPHRTRVAQARRLPAEGDPLRGLVQRVAARDEQALAALYDRTSSALFGFALMIVKNRADAEEVLVDVYRRAWRLAPAYSADRATVTGWLVTMTRSIAIDRLRSRAITVNHEQALPDEPRFASPGPTPESAAGYSEQRARVAAALQRLPEEQRECVELAFWQGMSHTEIAAVKGIPLGTAKTRLRIAITRLRRLLQGAH
jgi:RNA polymerase sigma-70 factor, ECF subfamily